MQVLRAGTLTALSLTACLVFGACRTENASTSDTQGRGTTTTNPSTNPGVLTAHISERPPDGTSAKLEPADDKDTKCARAPEGPVINSEPRVEVGARARICLFGFEKAGPVTFTMTAPQGKSTTSEHAADHHPTKGGITFYWYVPVEGPTGNWTVHFSRAGLSAEDEIQVGAPTYPHLTVTGTSPFDPVPDITAGDSIPLMLSGFPLDTDISLHVYFQASGDGPFRWANTLQIPPSEAKAGRSSVPTGTGDPSGRYCFVYEGTPFHDDGVCGSTLFELT